MTRKPASVSEDLAVDGRVTGLETQTRQRVLLACFLVLALGFFLRALNIVWKFDVDWEPDGYGHVVYAQSVFAAPPRSLTYGLHVWAKPLYTFVVGFYDALLPASLPRLPAVQLLNTGFWFFSMLLVLLLALERCRHAATVIALAVLGTFTYVFFRASITANTEPMGAFVLATALWQWHRGRRNLALLLFGLLPLIRMDAALVGAVFWGAAIRDLRRAPTRGSFVRSAAVASLLFVFPVALWNLAGFLHTGSALFILSEGYRGVGFFGFGRPLHFVTEFLKFDTVLLVVYCAGLLRIAVDRRGRDRMSVLMAVATGLHFVALNVMWVFGLASAGLLRYFVFLYPAYLLVSAVAFDWLFASLRHLAPRAIPVAVAALLAVTVAQLHWLVRPAEWHHNLLTAKPDSLLRLLPDNPAVHGEGVLYWDRADVLYYLGRNFTSPDILPLTHVKDPSAKGLFVFVDGWSPAYSKVVLQDFRGMQQLDRFPGPWGEVFYLFRR